MLARYVQKADLTLQTLGAPSELHRYHPLRATPFALALVVARPQNDGESGETRSLAYVPKRPFVMRRTLLITLAVVLVAVAGYATARIKRDFWDFEVYRQAGARVIAAEPLYRPDDGHYQFKYWPAFALAMVPFGAMPPEAGKVIWYALTTALIAVFIRQSIRALPDRQSSVPFLTWWTLLVTGKFLVKELVNGQTNVLLGVLVLLALAAAQQGRLRAGVLVAAAAFVKPYALLFLPWLAVAQGIAAAGVAFAALVAGWIAPAVVYGWHGNLTLLADWYRTVVETTSANLLFPENISFAAMWAKWIGVGPAATGLAAASAIAGLAVAIVLWVRRGQISRPGYLEISYLLLLIPLISPQGWDYVLLVATPAIVCLLDRFRGSPRRWQVATASGFLLTSFTIYDLLGRTFYLSLMSLSAITVGTLLLAASLVRLRLTAAA